MKYTTMRPQPSDRSLPSGWICTQWTATTLTVTRDGGRFELVAIPTSTAMQCADLGMGQCWEVTAHQRHGDLTNETLIGHVPTQKAAATVLRASMNAINRALHETETTEWMALSSVLAEIEVPYAIALGADVEDAP
jgi:hypothetical protein